MLAIGGLFVLDLTNKDLEDHASTLTAPTLIGISFFQTIALYVDIDVPWPHVMRECMLWLSSLNLNLDLVKAECSYKFSTVDKMKLTLMIPFATVFVVAMYSSLKYTYVHYSASSTKYMRQTIPTFLKQKAATVFTTAFTAGSIFFVRALLRPFACVADNRGSSVRFMASSPDIRCSDDDADYVELVKLVQVGLLFYFGLYFGLATALVRAKRSPEPGLSFLAFMGDKFEVDWFYWEMVIIARKLGVMASFYLGSSQQGWMGGTSTLIISMVLHVYARPYENSDTDWSEFLTLVASVLVLVSGAVFTILGDDEGNEDGSANAFRIFLEITGGLTVLGAIVSIAVAQVRVIRALRLASDDDDDYKIRTTRHRLAEAEDRVSELARQVETQERETKVRKREFLDAQAFINPLSIRESLRNVALEENERKEEEEGGLDEPDDGQEGED